MHMLRLIKILFPQLIVISMFIFIISCGSSGNQQTSVEENGFSAFDSSQGKSFTYSKYELPLSVDIYKFLKKEKIPYNILLMHKLKDQDKYFTEIKRAFVMGVYSSDLAYVAIYEESQDAVEYFGATIDLANKLNIQDGYNSTTLDRAYKNLNNSDSLPYIISESYWKTCVVLEKTKRDNILPMIVGGSWIESMHILSRNCIGSKQGSTVYVELYNQLRHLENMILFLDDASKDMKVTGSKTEISLLSKKLGSIKQKYQSIDGTDPSNFNLAQFKDVIFQIEDLRNSMLE
jgi:hypothetical protein